MRDLLDSGKIGAAGVSNYSLARWRKADAALGRPVISNQVQFSLARASALKELVPFAEREKRIVIAWSPLAQGLLGGKYGLDNRPGGIRATNPLFGTENLRRVEPLFTGAPLRRSGVRECRGATGRAPGNHDRQRRRGIGTQDRVHHLDEVLDGHHFAGHDAPR
jgi:hypothetical protein